VASLGRAVGQYEVGFTQALSGLMRRVGDWLDSQVAQPVKEPLEKDGAASQKEETAASSDGKMGKNS